jgi:EAL domain-containing protein (putative c-di-GMP-specific phosphodiesterase class I)
VLLDPPRDGRPLKALDIANVRVRLRNHLQAHLDQCVPNDMAADFGCYVGGTTMLHQEGVPVERILNRALEESFADALREKNREEKEYLLGLMKIMESELIRSVYQPVVDIYERRTIGFEALTRVIGGRFSNPETLFRTAHQNNVLWSLERLCRRKALDGLPALTADQLLFLNIEPDSIHDPELLDTTFSERLQEAGLSPEQIVLEMTERSAIRDFAAVRRTSEKFREMGFRLAMDDVGSGYSGLQAIAEISPDFLKVDMSLVRDLHANPIKRELVNTIRKFADATGISLVA